MFLTKYSPRSPLETLFDDDFLPALTRWIDPEKGEKEMFRLPMTNVNETDKEFVLTMEMPGVQKKDIDVSVEDGHLVVTGERNEKIKTDGLLRREIRSEKFRRSFLLDSSVDRDRIKAKLDHGVLTVTLAKRADSVGRKISVD